MNVEDLYGSTKIKELQHKTDELIEIAKGSINELVAHRVDNDRFNQKNIVAIVHYS